MARLGILSDPLKHLIHRIKYAGKWPVAEKLADRLLSSGRLDATLRETDVLLPVPLHWYRHMQRGFNQADVIATRLAARWKGDRIKVVRPVVRLVATETQTHLHGRAKREENLKHAFGLIRPQPIAGKRVTIVDDVTTTGATLLSLARTIKSAGPASMNAITLAIADPDGKQFEVV
jgi:ComF family protein